MKSNQLGKTLGDYVAIAICPALIMTLVGSLVYFLIEILYRGGYPERLQHVFACFIFSTVLIARISMYDKIKAGALGTALAIAAMLCLFVFVEFPKNHPLFHFTWLVNIAMLAIVWWSSHKLTWDCTFIDESEEAGGEGLLDAAGLDQNADAAKPGQADDGEKANEPTDWWSRWKRAMAEEKKKAHTPGVWVVYFSLAALPLFGLGQLLNSTAGDASRAYTFKLLAVYVASGLGLLLTTTYLGLRRYLRQRKLKMPGSMTAVWLALGGGLIAALLGVGMILPRPSPDSSFSKWMNQATSTKRQASKYAQLRDGAGKGEGAASKNAKGDPNAKPGAGQQTGKEGNRTKPGENPSTTGQGSQGGGSGGNKSQSGGQDKSQQRGNQSQSGQGKDPNQEGDKGQGGKENQQQSGKAGNDDQNSQKNQNQSGPGGKTDPGNQSKQDPGNKDASQNNEASGPNEPENQPNQDPQNAESGDGDSSNYEGSSDMMNHASEWGGTVASIMKWIMILIGVCFGGYFLLKALANFAPWARGLLDWLRSLFGGSPSEPDAPSSSEPAAPAREETPPPFSSFRNPFQDGSAQRMTPEQLVRHTFAALEAWAWEQRMGRKPEETPLEFAERIADLVPKMSADLKRVGNLFAFVAYARGKVPSSSLETLQQFWQKLESRAAAAERSGELQAV